MFGGFVAPGSFAGGDEAVSLILDDGMSEEELMAWLESLDTSEDVPDA